MPNGFKPHPVLVISNDEVNEMEEAFLGMMLSSKNVHPELTFEITPDMVTNPNFKSGFAVCHLVAIISEKEILGRFGSLKKEYLE